ncbi:MAG: ABC transporter permease [Oculatellaceae cyanobacterium Prado106]|nr:ABC transporter permease [Oculatellaceae cyanobacterium Prado106]
MKAISKFLFALKMTLWGTYSVWRRHAKVYQRSFLFNCIPPLFEPIIYLVAFGFGLSPLIREVSYLGNNIPYLNFIAPAMIGIGLLFQSFFEGAYGSFVRLAYVKTWQTMLTAPLNFTEVFMGEWFWAATKGMIVGTLTGIAAIALGLYTPLNLLISLPIMLLSSLLFAALGVVTASLVNQVDQVNIPIFLVIVPMTTFCGTYFPRDNLPFFLRPIANTLPLAAIVDLLRWPLGLPSYWWIGLLWIIVLLILVSSLAARLIYPKVIR